MSWMQWISQNWVALAAGAKIEVPQDVGQPQEAGFRITSNASPEGQLADWALAMSDRSRIHVHVYADGRRIAHRDKHDPDRGIGDKVAHLLVDTPLGVLAILGGTLWLATSNER
jgi:hypothetical protein